jgi:hypothetical protein
MQVLQETAGQGNSMPKFSKETSASKEQMQDAETMMMTAPIPGQSLTQDPQSRLPYEQPPKFSDVQEFIDETFMRFTDEEGLPNLLDAMRHGLPVEHVAEKYLMRAFKDGDITPDMLLLCIEPTIYMLISLATYANIDPVLYPEDDMVDEDERTSTDLYKQATQELLKSEDPEADDGRLTVQDLNAPAVMPKSLLARAEQAVNQGGQNGL